MSVVDVHRPARAPAGRGAYDQPMTEDPGTAWLNELDPDAARSALRPCCAATGWLDAVVAGRPYPDRAGLLATAARALAGLDWSGVRQALDAHPRIGQAPSSGGDTEAAWSRREQSAMDSASDGTRAALVAANRAYEERFGHIFLIFASGRTDTELLAAARSRTDNDEATERAVVRTELGRIVALRLDRLLDAVTA